MGYLVMKRCFLLLWAIFTLKTDINFQRFSTAISRSEESFQQLQFSPLNRVYFVLTNVLKTNFNIKFHCFLFAALLSETLRTYTRTGCDHEPITLSCPRGTSISIDVAQYMPTSMENECVAATENIIQDGVVNAGTEIEIKAPEKCSWPNVMSVSWNIHKPIRRFFDLKPFGRTFLIFLIFMKIEIRGNFIFTSLSSKRIASVDESNNLIESCETWF